MQNPLDPLLALYQKWEALSLEEGQAIANGAWPVARQAQNAKQALQTQIIAATETCKKAAHQLTLKWSDLEPQIAAVIQRLVQIERANADQLQGQRLQAQAQHSEHAQIGRRLAQIRKAYVKRKPPIWTSYS